MNRTDRIAEFVVARARGIAVLILILTAGFFYPIANAGLTSLGHPLPGPVLRMGSSATANQPDHPFIRAQRQFEGIFGNASHVILALVVADGSVFNPETLAKLKRITDRLDGAGFDLHQSERSALLTKATEGMADVPVEELRLEMDLVYPPYPVNHDHTRSLTHRSSQVVVEVNSAGDAKVETLIESLPKTDSEAREVRRRVFEMAPELVGELVSEDERAALVKVQFVTHRLASPSTYRAVADHIQSIIESEEDEKHRLYAVGNPVVVGWVLRHSWEIGASIVASLFLVALLLWFYFRRLHGILIPMFASGVTAIWGFGFAGWAGLALDPLMLVIPMVISARAISHTVQMAERFFQEYERRSIGESDLAEAKRAAARASMSNLIVPGTLGVVTDVAGLLVILVTTIPRLRDLGIVGAFWVASIIVTVEVLHPVLITLLPPPRTIRHFRPTAMISIMERVARYVTDPKGRWVVAGTTVAVLVGASWIVANYATIGESRGGTALFWPSHPVNRANHEIVERFGGADTLVIYARGDREHSAERIEAIEGLEALERQLRIHAGATRSISLIEMVRGINRQLRDGDPKFSTVGDVSAWTAIVRIFSPPGILRPLVSDDGRAASLTVFFQDHKGETIRRAIETCEYVIEHDPIGTVSIRLVKNSAEPGAALFDSERIKDFLYYAIGPILPARAHTLRVSIRTDGDHVPEPIGRARLDGPPDWAEYFRLEAHLAYEEAKRAAVNGRVFTWPDFLVNWELDEIDQWWESDELGLRAVVVRGQALIVQDLLSREKQPEFQTTRSYTRGVELILAGGSMGLLAAVNEEVERGHLANISLIFAIIFILHSLTYRSILSGGIVILQIACATLLSLAYLAIRGIGLDLHTLPVQAVGVGIGVDYAIYIVDRIRQECGQGGDVDAAIRTAIGTTGVAVGFTATAVIGGIFFWIFASLRFQAEMAQLLIVLMAINMLGAVTIVPAFYSILKPGGIESGER